MFTLDGYRTDFVEQVVVDLDASANEIQVYNLTGKAFTQVLQAEIEYTPVKKFDVRAAYKYVDAKSTYQGELREVPLTFRHRGLVNLPYEWRQPDLGFDFTTQFYGQSRLPDMSDNHAAHELGAFPCHGRTPRRPRARGACAFCPKCTKGREKCPSPRSTSGPTRCSCWSRSGASARSWPSRSTRRSRGSAGGSTRPGPSQRTRSPRPRPASPGTRSGCARAGRPRSTSSGRALRDASGGEAIVEACRGLFGVPARVLSGEEEARATFRGALSGMADVSREVVVFDIGGGSTEIVLGAPGGATKEARSYDVGSVRLTERISPSDPPTTAELEATQRLAEELLEGVTKDPDEASCVGIVEKQLAKIEIRCETEGAIVKLDGVQVNSVKVGEAIVLYDARGKSFPRRLSRL